MKVLTVANRKGGAGKSTCAAHIALEAVRKGMKVILLDLDPQKTLESWWKKREEDNPYLADANASDLDEKIRLLSTKGLDLCIIDTPGDTSANATVGIQAADMVLIPSKPTAPDLTAIGRTISIVKEHKKPFIFVVTQAIPRSNNALQAASVLSEFGPVAPSSIVNRVAYANAMSTGESASSFDKSAEEEVRVVWEYISSKMMPGKITGIKEKVA